MKIRTLLIILLFMGLACGPTHGEETAQPTVPKTETIDHAQASSPAPTTAAICHYTDNQAEQWLIRENVLMATGMSLIARYTSIIDTAHSFGRMLINNIVNIIPKTVSYGSAMVNSGTAVSPFSTIPQLIAGPIAGMAAYFGLASLGNYFADTYTDALVHNKFITPEQAFRKKQCNSYIAHIGASAGAVAHYCIHFAPPRIIDTLESRGFDIGSSLFSNGARVYQILHNIISPTTATVYSNLTEVGAIALGAYTLYLCCKYIQASDTKPTIKQNQLPNTKDTFDCIDAEDDSDSAHQEKKSDSTQSVQHQEDNNIETDTIPTIA